MSFNTKIGRGIVADHSGDIEPAVRITPYSIGYVAHPFVQGTTVASLVNSHGSAVLPSVSSVTNAINSNNFNGSVVSSCIFLF